MLVDAHVNFSHKDIINSVDEIVKDAEEEGVTRLLAVNSNIYNFQSDYDLIKNYDQVDLTIGHHPCQCDQIDLSKFSNIFDSKLNSINKIKIIGETGLDYFYDTNKNNQIKSLELHIEKAINYNLPILLHIRDAFDDILEILNSYKKDMNNILIHCYTGDEILAKKFLDLGCYFSFTGIITFKNADSIRNAIKVIPMENIFFETDSPYLAPVPLRGKINLPKYLKYIVEFYAKEKNKSFKEVSNISTNNYLKFINV